MLSILEIESVVDPNKVESILELIKLWKRQFVNESNFSYEDGQNAALITPYILELEKKFSLTEEGLSERLIINFNDIKEYAVVFSDITKNLESSVHSYHFKMMVQQTNTRAKSLLKSEYSIVFTEDDLERAQELVNEIRDIIAKNDKLEEDHRRRLLRRLETLQSEMHKHVSDVDRIFGFAADAGTVARKLGEDAKPITDRVRELLEIGWRSKAESEGLPSGEEIPLLQKS